MANQPIEEEKKYYDFTFRGSDSRYYHITGYFSEQEKSDCIDWHQSKYIQSKLIGVDDTHSVLN